MQIEREKTPEWRQREQRRGPICILSTIKTKQEMRTGYRAVAATKHGAGREYARDRQRKSSRQGSPRGQESVSSLQMRIYPQDGNTGRRLGYTTATPKQDTFGESTFYPPGAYFGIEGRCMRPLVSWSRRAEASLSSALRPMMRDRLLIALMAGRVRLMSSTRLRFLLSLFWPLMTKM